MLMLLIVLLVLLFLEDVICDVMLIEIIIWLRFSKWFKRVIIGLFYYDRYYSWFDFICIYYVEKRNNVLIFY